MNEMLSAEAIKNKQTTYWRNRSVDALTCASLIQYLSVDRPSPGRRRARVGLEISDEASGNLLRIAGGSDMAVYILFVTVFKAAVARFTGEPRVSLLSPTYREPATRALASSRGGADYVLLQDQVDLGGGLRENGAITQRTVIGAYSNQDYFAAELTGASRDLVDAHVLISSQALHDRTDLSDRSPLVAHVSRRGTRLEAELVLDPDVVEQRLAESFARYLSLLVDRSSRETSRAFNDIEWLADADAARLAAFSQGTVRPIEDCALHELFEWQAGKTPLATALSCGDQRVTYAELNAMSERAARGLVARGVKPGDFVVLLYSRSVEMVAAILAVGKAGAAFVPVGSDLPAARVAAILDQASPRCVLTNLERSKVPGGALVLTVDEASASGDDAIALPPSREFARDGIAYAIFTSGSTGTPKGVLIEHRGIVNAVTCWTAAHGVSPGHRMLQVFSSAFDGFVLTFFSSLAGGATTVLVKDNEARTPSALVRHIRQHAITHSCLTPALFHGILEEASEADLSSLVGVALAGDVTRRATVALCRSLNPRVALSNGYGPTENSVVSTFHPNMEVESVQVIGKPVGNVGLYILDAALRPVPPGVFGQIALSGPGLARGYLNDPERTAERFVTWRGQRIYLSGDVGRWRPDGTVEFRGRSDDQVKLRGYRIELEDIRRQLLLHDGVKEAVVFVDEAVPDAALVACFTASDAVNVDALREHLRARLPEYMVPAEVVRLDEIPLTQAGKYDLVEVRARARSQRARSNDEQPSTDVERRLAVMWSKLLELDNIAVNKSFFALGGHSLKATRLLARIHAEFGVTLSLDEVFRSNTVRKLAAVIEREREPLNTAIQTVGDRAGYPLSPAQQRMLVLAADDALQMSYSVPVVFELAGELDVAWLEASLNAVVKRHDGLRTYFVWEESGVSQAIERECTLSIRRQTVAATDDLSDALRALRTRFDLSRAPLLAVTLVDAADRGRYLFFEFHHVIVDETSLGIFFRELQSAYNRGELGPVPSLRYVDYATWQRDQQRASPYMAQLAYWKDKLARARLGPVALPFTEGSDGCETGRGDQHVVCVDEQLANSIRELCRREELTLFMLFAGSFALHLHRLTRQDEIVIGSPISERSRPETHGVIGLFLNTLPLLYRFDERAAVGQFLQTVKKELLRDMANADAQLEDILRSLAVARTVDNRSVFNVMVAMIEDGAETLRLGDTKARAIDVHNGTAKFDLLLEVRATDGDLRLVFEYARERLHASTVEALGRGFVALLQRIVAAPDVALAGLGVLDDGEPWRIDASPPTVSEDDTRAVLEDGALANELVRTWANVLKISPDGIGRNDSFFMLGGDSLAVTVVAKAVREWGYPVKLRELFANDTIAKLCALLGDRRV
ncbi:non-ribosomal peptide synthetase [Myxococcus sp. AM010]|uniref:non-ribosomal peptide synthetase n=1 Tax=Myxococcus sp. AM010 TaxID=2745138 RepID=UPI001594F4B2|nr:non-ribosomal peptide synthetase [Myxococcus sp. AM010]NVJ12935.1 amino acid adenylation domain-containing protein [Myxococcus sp. AM010]